MRTSFMLLSTRRARAIARRTLQLLAVSLVIVGALACTMPIAQGSYYEVTDDEGGEWLGSVIEVDGSLQIGPSDLVGLTASQLRHVEGHLTVEGNRLLERLLFPRLDKIGGVFTVGETSVLGQLDLPELAASGEVSFDVPLSMPVSLPSLARTRTLAVRGGQYVTCPELTDVESVGLWDLGGDASFERLLQVYNLSISGLNGNLAMPSLVTAGTMLLTSFHGSANIFLPVLRETGRLQIMHADGLLEVDLPELVLTADLQIAENPTIHSVRLNSLSSIGGAVNISNNANLSKLHLADLVHVDGVLIVVGNPVLSQCDVDAIIARLVEGGFDPARATSSGNNQDMPCSED